MSDEWREILFPAVDFLMTEVEQPARSLVWLIPQRWFQSSNVVAKSRSAGRQMENFTLPLESFSTTFHAFQSYQRFCPRRQVLRSKISLKKYFYLIGCERYRSEYFLFPIFLWENLRTSSSAFYWYRCFSWLSALVLLEFIVLFSRLKDAAHRIRKLYRL